MKTEFRPEKKWPRWRPDAAALAAVVELGATTFDDDVPRIRLSLLQPERSDTAESLDEARDLLRDDRAVDSGVHLQLSISGSHETLDSLDFSWWGTLAQVAVTGSDEISARALRDRLSAMLEVGALEPDAPPSGPGHRPPVEEKTQLSLGTGRYSGTYDDLHSLIVDMAEQVRQVRGAALDYIYIALTERGITVTVRHLTELSRITSRDVGQLRHLSVALGSSLDGPAVSLYLRPARVLGRMGGYVEGPDEAPVRALRAAANDLLRDRGGLPKWVAGLALPGAGGLAHPRCVDDVRLLGDAVSFGFDPSRARPSLSIGAGYLPDIELLTEDQKPRWRRWSLYILGLAITWLIGSLALPIFGR